MSTLNSNVTSYLSGLVFLDYVDIRVVADLLSDNRQRLAGSPDPDPTQISNTPRLLRMLSAASGEVEAACLAGTRYAISDLQLLVGTNSGELLNQIIAGLTLEKLYNRRPDWNPPPLVQISRDLLERLRGGEEVFGILEAQRAGIPSHYVETPDDVYARRGLVVIGKRYYGKRVQERWPNYGSGYGGC